MGWQAGHLIRTCSGATGRYQGLDHLITKAQRGPTGTKFCCPKAKQGDQGMQHEAQRFYSHRNRSRIQIWLLHSPVQNSQTLSLPVTGPSPDCSSGRYTRPPLPRLAFTVSPASRDSPTTLRSHHTDGGDHLIPRALSELLLVCLLVTCNFEVIIDSRAVIRNTTERDPVYAFCSFLQHLAEL